MSELADAPPSQIHPVRRAFTLPTRLNPRVSRKSDSFGPSENDLFYHPSAKVVHFAPRAVAPIPSSTAPSDFDYPVDAVETLPWRSPTERTVAFAPLRLEKVHGLTVFLKCGNVVHAILKNSQCWCVDGESTFVLRIRPLTYYRIELPNETSEDKEYSVALKEALPKILRYEVTPCPFKRGFTVEIPEEAKVRRRKKAWRPKGRRESAPVYAGNIQEKSPTRKDVMSDFLSAGEDTDGNTTDDSCFTTKGSTSTMLETIPDDEPSVATDIPVVEEEKPADSTADRCQNEALQARLENADSAVGGLPLSSSVESFHSMGPSSPTVDVVNCTSRDTTEPAESHIRNNESLSAMPAFKEVDWDSRQVDPSPKASVPEPERTFIVPGGLPDDNWSVTTQSSLLRTPDSNPDLNSMSVEFRRRSKVSREREISPMPPASALVLPSEKSDATTIIQKTCTLVLVPPIQLLIVLIHIAARIVIGPALNSTTDDLSRKFECQITNPQEAVDDFDLPLAPNCSKRPSGSKEADKLDPWQLD